MSDSTPSFGALHKIEERLLVAKLQAARQAISHAGEKGRALESEVSSLIRSFLPSEYGISTGFIVYHTDSGPKLSSQLDIIIYDAIRTGPIAKLSTCDVFPLEAVYAYIEVKAILQSTSDEAEKYSENSIEKCLENNKRLRNMKDRRFWTPSNDSPVTIELKSTRWLGLRSYVIAFEPKGTIASDTDAFAQRMSTAASKLGPPTHLHGVFIADHAYFSTRPVDVRKAKEDDYYHVRYVKDNAFTAFKLSLISALSSYPRFPESWSPAFDQYYQNQIEWFECSPEK